MSENVSFEEYFEGNELSSSIFQKKYCLPGDKSVSDVFRRVARGLAQYEVNKVNPEKCKAQYWEDAWTQEMLDGWYRPGGSILAGVGNRSKVSLANCTTIGLAEDTINCISDTQRKMMKCAAARQGLGVDVSNIRPRGARVNNAANESGGVVPWMDYLQSIAKYVGQQGRIPAMLISLNVGHPDIEEFIGCKTDLNMINNANISVQITDEFMEAVENDDDWHMNFSTPHETFHKTISARKLLRLIAAKACETAEPGVQYIDQARRGTMIHQIYEKTKDKRFKVISTNACSEKFLANTGICLLGSLNMGKFSPVKDIYLQQLQDIVPSFVRLMDNAIEYEIDYNRSPLPEQRWMVEHAREMGLGITNVHTWLLKQGLAYDSDEAIEAVEEFFANYMHIAFQTSMDLAKEKGPCKAYELYKDMNDPEYLMGSIFYSNMIKRFYPNFHGVGPLRNLAIGSVAPTGSLSMTFSEPALSSGIEPAIGAYYWRKTRALSSDNKSWKYFFCFPEPVKRFVVEHEDFQNLTPEEQIIVKTCPESQEDNDGQFGIAIVNIIEPILKKVDFKPAHDIDPFQKIKLMSRLYNWLDAACSVTYNLPKGTTPELIEKIYYEAWKKGVRAVSVYVDGSREGILVFEPPTKEDTKEKVVFCDERPDHLTFTCAPKREKKLPCDIHKCKIKGKDWLVLVGMLEGYPYEIFAGEYDKDEMYVPNNVTEGHIIKNGKGSYSLLINIKGAEVEYKNIAQTFMNERYRSMTRMISLALRHGVRPVYIIDQIKKADEDITEFSSAVNRVLNKYIKSLDYAYLSKSTGFKCEFCGSDQAIFNGGCKICANCGKGSRCD